MNFTLSSRYEGNKELNEKTETEKVDIIGMNNT